MNKKTVFQKISSLGSSLSSAVTGAGKLFGKGLAKLEPTINKIAPKGGQKFVNKVLASPHSTPVVGAVTGGLLGGTYGALKDPGYDSEGNKKSRVISTIKGMAGGGILGGMAGSTYSGKMNFGTGKVVGYNGEKLNNIKKNMADAVSKVKDSKTNIAP